MLSRSKYRDVTLFLWLIPAINVINYYLTYTRVHPLWRLLVTFTIDVLEGYIAWLIARTIILWLDKKVPFDVNPYKRIAVQLILTLLAGMGAIILLTELVNALASHKRVPTSFYTKDILIIAIWFFVVNGIYIGLHYYLQWKQAEEKVKEEQKIKAGGFRVSTAKKELLFAFEELGGFYIDGDYSVVVTMERKKYLLDFSLDNVEKNLPAASFFRLNRQYIIHRQLVAGFEKGRNGKINVLLKDAEPLPQTISVSRTRAPEFKSWFSPL